MYHKIYDKDMIPTRHDPKEVFLQNDEKVVSVPLLPPVFDFGHDGLVCLFRTPDQWFMSLSLAPGQVVHTLG